MLISKIDKLYEKHDCKRICQGDILRDFSFLVVSPTNREVDELLFPYLIVITQDCDLEQHFKKMEKTKEEHDAPYLNQFLPNILVIPAFTSDNARAGEHLRKIFNVTKQPISSDIWKKITQNNDERYHFLPECQELQVPALLLDFKTYMTISSEDLVSRFSAHYLVTINELFREHLSHRFCGYLSRIGLPNLTVKTKQPQ